MKETKATVFILCRNRLLTESIARMLRKSEDLKIFVSCPVGCSGTESGAGGGARIAVLDSLAVLQEYSRAADAVSLGCQLSCILVGMEDDHQSFLEAIQSGARGYLLHNASARDLKLAVYSMAEGGVVCPPPYVRLLFDLVAGQAEKTLNPWTRANAHLSRREMQLLPLIGRGLSNKEIASHFNLSEQTIKNHVHRILRKAGVKDRLSAVRASGAPLPFSIGGSVAQSC